MRSKATSARRNSDMARLAKSSMTAVSVIFLVMNPGQLFNLLFCAVSNGAAGWRAASKISIG